MSEIRQKLLFIKIILLQNKYCWGGCLVNIECKRSWLLDLLLAQHKFNAIKFQSLRNWFICQFINYRNTLKQKKTYERDYLMVMTKIIA